MTHGRAPGAPGARDAARRALRGLVMAATVRIHRPDAGYALDEPGTFLGSGYFVAPSWVLTCAHVACGGEGGEVVVVYEPAPGRGMSAVPGHVAAALPEGAGSVPGGWPAPDLALVRLSEPVDHECVYLSERPAAYFGEGTVLYAGWTVVDGHLRMLDGTLTVEGTIGGWTTDVQMRLGNNDLPDGVSGGPVIDPERGEVIGVLKSRSDHARGGTSTGLEQLRTLPVPAGELKAEADDLYQAVVHAHDRYHRDRQRHPDARRHTWADVQNQLGARPGQTLSPDERVQLLGRLADLPPPASTRSLLDLLGSLPDFEAPAPLPAPRGWRDGLGALYEYALDDGALYLVLDYAVHVMTADRPFLATSTPAAEEALWAGVWQAAQRLGPGRRSALLERRRTRMAARPPAPVGGAGGRAGAATGRSSVLVEIVRRGWEPDHCDWSVFVVRSDGEAKRIEEVQRVPLADLPAHLSAPLKEAFRQCDTPGRPAVLQVATEHSLLALDVDEWRLGPEDERLGTQRPVVLRCTDRDQLMEDGEYGPYDPYGGKREGGGSPAAVVGGDRRLDVDEERRARWRWLHAHPVTAAVLDCDDGLRKPVPPVEELRGLSHGTVPVLCRFDGHGHEGGTDGLARLVRGGFGVALWRRRHGLPEAVCGEFHRGTLDQIAGPAGAHRLPEAVHDLRSRLRSGRPETFWAHGIALLYDDPHQPLPGAGDLLEAP
ncbi:MULTISPECIES: VMAP-C domain-containing protein [Streptomyces]|uniref:VMAP-C domain-containing protein n=1 Tax=Streptomyces TaxID=1883 RepID=UPI0006E4487C|nr:MULTISPECIES: trypsin-like peptidase domain-containing protein [unclassified Streptomyces]NEB65388.1 trypsin-like peptidase domain-containing protein [Streptomyces diastaticus]